MHGIIQIQESMQERQNDCRLQKSRPCGWGECLLNSGLEESYASDSSWESGCDIADSLNDWLDQLERPPS